MKRIVIILYTCISILLLAACGPEMNPGSTTEPPATSTTGSELTTQASTGQADAVFNAGLLDIGIDNPFGRLVSFDELDSAFGTPISTEVQEAQGDDFVMLRDYGDVAVDVYISGRDSTAGGITKVVFYQGSIQLSPDYSIKIGASLDEILDGLKNEGNGISADDYYGQVELLYGAIGHMSYGGYVVYENGAASEIRLVDEGLLLEITLDSDQKASEFTFISES